MKKIILSTLFLFVLCITKAQSFDIQYSQVFTEFIGSPALQLKSGYTLFKWDDYKNKSLVLILFDENHKQIARNTIEFKKVDYTRRFAASVVTIIPLGFYEINGKIILFLKDNQVNKQMQCGLYRIIFNGKTGQLESEELLMTIDQGGFALTSPKTSMGMDSPFYFISKDESSDYYAIIKYANQKKNESTPNYEIYQYSGDHKEIGKVTFDYIDNKYAYARPLNLYVKGKYAIFATCAFNSEAKKDKDTKIYISKLENGKVTHREMPSTENYPCTYSIVKENKTNKLIEMMFYLELNKFQEQITYGLVMQTMDPETMQMKDQYPVPQAMTNNYVIEKFENKRGNHNAFVDQLYIDNKGNNLALLKKNSYLITNEGVATNNPEIIGLSYFSPEGKELDAWAYPYNSKWENARNMLIVSPPSGNYFLLNEMEANFDRPVNKKHEPIIEEDLTNTVVVTLGPNGELKKEYLFGKPVGKNKNIYADLTDAFYDSGSKTLIVVTNQGKGFKERKIAWIKFK